jgi:hypothetical protein
LSRNLKLNAHIYLNGNVYLIKKHYAAKGEYFKLVQRQLAADERKESEKSKDESS